ncbi:hypothetical protein LWI29_013274 [Acer saccharum]|uniref:Uncharacterized protein n=1 Tax=Acer saccharum TaxID=4024 RepID=A0AA39VZE3_ACESA|nr:hypothetical protein LWI29_013274 [Acer saccharum]
MVASGGGGRNFLPASSTTNHRGASSTIQVTEEASTSSSNSIVEIPLRYGKFLDRGGSLLHDLILESSNIMARLLSNMILKGIGGYPVANSAKIISGSSYHHGMKYFSTVPNDPDTHEDFRPTSKLESQGLSLKDIVEQDVKDNPVMIYMKGVPDFPQCGFSSLAVRVLRHYNVP